ncbi:MAG: HK97 family phage prohead protease [Gammaproteobacteria bacterium]|nr:HK97 family phage prohead protease [Gammaproteobacteria bacterium]
MDRIFTGECRAEGRTLSGTVLTFGEISPSHRERFLPGSLQREGDVWLDVDHDQRAVVCWEGSGLAFTETAGALTMRAEIPRTVPGDMALEGVRDGTRAGLSIEFSALSERKEAQTGIRVLERARLHGVGLVAAPSYPGSRVEARQRTGPGISGLVGLGEDLACRCRGPDCDSVRFAVDAFDDALAEAEAGDRIITIFLNGAFATPFGRVGAGLTVRRVGSALRVDLDALPESAAAAEFLESVRSGTAYTVRPYTPESTSEFVKRDRVAVFSRADLRAIEVAPLSGPVYGLREIEVDGETRRRSARRRVWL